MFVLKRCDSVVVYSLFYVAPLCVGVYVGSLFCSVVLGALQLAEEERAGCFTLIVLPRGAVG